jgi:uncharacterized protein YifE (UPF0438 family)
MTKSTPFESPKTFHALKYFPYGLSRSGEFTLEQVRLIETHGYAYQALANLEKEPINKEEMDFSNYFQLSSEQQQTPRTSHEKAWKTFIRKVANLHNYATSPSIVAMDSSLTEHRGHSK